MSSCITCTSARVLHSGACAGALWCFVGRRTVGPFSCCHSFTEAAPSGRDHVLVKSDPKAHFDPFPVVDEPPHASR